VQRVETVEHPDDKSSRHDQKRSEGVRLLDELALLYRLSANAARILSGR